MWIVIIGVIALFIFFNYKEPKTKKRSAAKTNQGKRQRPKTDIPGIDWVFKRELNAEGVPPIVNTYRKHLNGKGFEDIVKMIYFATEVEKNQFQSALMFMQISEPLLELMDLKYLERDEIEPLMKHFFEILIQQYSIGGAIGQLENIKDLYYFSNRNIPIFEGDLINAISNAKNEAEFRRELLKKLKTEEFVYQKDFKLIKGFDKIESGIYNLLEKLVNTNKIEKSKEGKYVIYKLKNK